MGVFRKNGSFWIDYYANGRRKRENAGRAAEEPAARRSGCSGRGRARDRTGRREGDAGGDHRANRQRDSGGRAQDLTLRVHDFDDVGSRVQAGERPLTLSVALRLADQLAVRFVAQPDGVIREDFLRGVHRDAATGGEDRG